MFDKIAIHSEEKFFQSKYSDKKKKKRKIKNLFKQIKPKTIILSNIECPGSLVASVLDH